MIIILLSKIVVEKNSVTVERNSVIVHEKMGISCLEATSSTSLLLPM